MGRQSFFWGLMLTLVGAVLLLDALDLLGGIQVWGLIWPVFLILLGLWIILGVTRRRANSGEVATISLERCSRARVRMHYAAGRLKIGSGAETGQLLEGNFSGGLQFNRKVVDDCLDVTMKLPAQFFPLTWRPGWLDWSIRLNQNVPVMLDLQTGACESHVDLQDLKIEKLVLQTGASSNWVRMPAHAGSMHAEIHSGAASVNVRIPEGVAARIRVQSGLASVSIDTSRFPRSDGFYQSVDYHTAENKVDLFIETGVSSIDVR